MDQADLQQVLRDLRFTAELTSASAAKLAALFERRDFPTGAAIFAEGADCPWFYVVAEGRVALEMCAPGRGCSRILTLGPGDVLAWSALLGEGRMTAGAHALTAVRTLAAPGPALAALCAADPEFGCEFYRGVAAALAKRLLGTRLQLLDLFGNGPATSGTTLPAP